MDSIKKLAFCVNPNKQGAQAIAEKLGQEAEKMGVQWKSFTDHPVAPDVLEGWDACCVIGGDGTMLSMVQACVKSQVPIFGVNLGKLGFLATLTIESACNCLRAILEGKFQQSKRFVLSCTNSQGQKTIGLNDVVIKHYAPSRLMCLSVYCNGEFVTSYDSDGLIISTPTGSTAYNLSSGGPILFPGSSVFALTPICPHTLTNRTVIFDNKRTLTVELDAKLHSEATEAHLSIDGQIPWKEENLFPLQVKISQKTLPLLQPLGYSHFDILRKKLQWGQKERPHQRP